MAANETAIAGVIGSPSTAAKTSTGTLTPPSAILISR
jgi:hypothetical protein